MSKQSTGKTLGLTALVLVLVMTTLLGGGCAAEEAPIAGFAANVTSGCCPLEVKFFDQSGGKVTDWAWDFDNDGTVDSTDRNPTYTYQTTGTHAVSLKATGPGGSDVKTKVQCIDVNSPPTAPQAEFTASPQSGTSPLAVQFTDQSTGTITDWHWDFDNDGIVDSIQHNPSHQYTAVGNYTVSLKATGPSGSSTKTKIEYIGVTSPPPEADFTAMPTSGDTPLQVQFTDQSTGTITDWHWDFDNDGTTDSIQQNPSHQYTTIGNYTISLEVTGPGGSDVETKVECIDATSPPTAPQAEFTASPTSGITPLAVQFTDQSTGTVTDWHWDFDNDGIVDSIQHNPSHQYTAVGNYTVSLKATGPGGSSTKTKIEYIDVADTVTSPLVKPTIELSGYLKGSTVDFDQATLNAIAEGGGEVAYKLGLAMSIYPSTRFSATALDALTNIVFPPPYKILPTAYDATGTTYAMLTESDQMAVLGVIFASMPQAEQDVVTTAVNSLFERQDNDTADAVDPDQSSPYGLLQEVSVSAAAGWLSDLNDLPAGQDWADRFFIRMMLGPVQSYPVLFEDVWGPLGYTLPLTEAQEEIVARIVGESSFRDGIASALHPNLANEQANLLYGTDYADLDPNYEAPYVDQAVHKYLGENYSAFGNVSQPAVEATIDAVRDGVATTLAAYWLVSGSDYSMLPALEQALVDQVIFSQLEDPSKPLGFGPALEWDYVTFGAVPEAISGFNAEMTDALELDETICYLTLSGSVSYSAAEGWLADVESGVDVPQAFYRWWSKESVVEMTDAAPMIRLSLGEFSLKITNPNDYEISVDSIDMNARIETASSHGDVDLGTAIDAARLSADDRVWIPANDEITLALRAPTKVSDVIAWLVAGGEDAATAAALAADVFDQIQAGTVAWLVTVEVTVSSEAETITETYSLQWSP